MKVKIDTLTQQSHIVQMAQGELIAPHFTLKELANNAGSKELPQYILSPDSDRFNACLESFRVWYDYPIVVSSGYRQEAYNKRIKGADPKSCHLIACAIDFNRNRICRWRDDEIAVSWQFELLKAAYGPIIGEINFYDGYLHIGAFSDKQYGYKKYTIRDYRRSLFSNDLRRLTLENGWNYERY